MPPWIGDGGCEVSDDGFCHHARNMCWPCGDVCDLANKTEEQPAEEPA